MNQNLFSSLIERDAYSGILYLVLGGLILLSVYHLAMFFQNREKCYLLYSSYIFFSFLAYIPVLESGFISTLSPVLGFGEYTKILFTIVFNCLYFFFFANFLHIKDTNLKWYRIMVYPAAALLLIAIAAFISQKYFGTHHLYAFKSIFIVLITLHTAICFYLLLKLRNNLKYYIIFGALVLFVCSLAGTKNIRDLPAINISRKMGDFIYFMGLFVENLAFSLALGHKQKITSDNQVRYQKDLVVELRKNELLKDEVNFENEKILTIENEKIKYLQEISNLKLSVLQNQMNPHFIFNALNSIKYCIIENDSKNAVNYLTKFSKIIRTILAASKMKEFTLAEELHTLQIYVDIENLRFSEPIDFKITTGDGVNEDAVKLPPMVLQPFIENAIVHGVSTLVDKKIHLEISLDRENVKICITDNGIGREEATKLKAANLHTTKSVGIDIAREMLTNYFSPLPFSLEYKDLSKNGSVLGTKVLIIIPKRA